jgi:NAD-dependent dihydropyrimidine dehydrogenase PreA subunit
MAAGYIGSCYCSQKQMSESIPVYKAVLYSLLLDILQTVLRMIPWSTEPGLYAVGNPDSDSPVVLTCNYDLTVRQVARVLAENDVWLVVAPSSGINVWCAAAGGHFGTHQIVTALKTCGIEAQVNHRRVILPQLSATGVLAREVSKRCGWKVRFGPAYATDLPRYLATGQKNDESMRRVHFRAFERMEMAFAWGFPMALVVVILVAPFRSNWCLPLAILIICTALAIFSLYDRIPSKPGITLSAVITGIALACVWAAGGNIGALLTALIFPGILVALLTFDYPGSTPIAGGAHFEERNWHIVVDAERCRGVFSCFEVCPEACFTKQDNPRFIYHSSPDRCIRCGACIVQCSQDALWFEDEQGQRIEPEQIRRYKLNLLGQRTINTEDQFIKPPV